MSKHTPGPWRTHQINLDEYRVIKHHNDDSSYSTVAAVSGYEGLAEANARLMSAAPEMLSQLKILRDKLIQYAGPETALYEIGDTNQIIAKAEGVGA